MLSKKHRLTSRGDFIGVFKGNLHARSGPFSLVCHKNNFSFYRFGFIVSLMVSKKAVHRNKLRRQLHEIVRSLFSFLAPGYDCVIRAYPGAEKLKYNEIEYFVREMFGKIKFL